MMGPVRQHSRRLLMSASSQAHFIARWTLAMAVVATLVLPAAANANGRVAKFITQVAGPYEIALGTIPDTPVVGNLHLTMTVTDTLSNTLVLDAEVTVTGTGPEGNGVEIGPLVAQNNPTSPAFYDITTSVDRIGIWTLTVSVSSDLGDASTDFALKVQTRNPISRVLTWVTVLVFLALVGLGLLPFLRQRGRRRRQKRTRSR